MSCFLFNALNYVFGSKGTMILHICMLFDVTLFVLKFAIVKKNLQPASTDNSIMINIVYGSGIFSVVQYKNDQTKQGCRYRNRISLFGTFLNTCTYS